LVDSEAVWLTGIWPFVRRHLPPAPARVLELGCGGRGGHVPSLLAAGFDAVGVDPEAPEGPDYRRMPFEEYVGQPVDVLVASLSLHHVEDLDLVLDKIRGLLVPGGTLIVVEWARESMDEATARWCFQRLSAVEDDTEGWLHRRRREWLESGLSWERYREDWAVRHHLYTARAIRSGLDARFTTDDVSWGPYYFPELSGVDRATEQAAIDAGEIRAGCLCQVGQRSR
jgi:SAM-dependent methyltransferase